MVNVSYVYPNTCELPQRGGLVDRWRLAVASGCGCVEVPADFVKGVNEERKTGLSVCSFLSPDAIAALYEWDVDVPEELEYCLHTEPSLPREDQYGLVHQAALMWHNKEWVKQFAAMTLDIGRFFGKPPRYVEIHPGDQRNTFKDLLFAVHALLDGHAEVFGKKPLVLVENRTNQFISKGSDIASFWQFIVDEEPALRGQVGVVLDVSQFFTVTRAGFEAQLGMIPLDAVKGLHVHFKHVAPSLSDVVPWMKVFDKVKRLNGEVLVNPEVSHRKNVAPTIAFCKKHFTT
ncbi:MAG: hypothetical protein NWE95_05915 [Candidatus Bathyarchaeota archaeon]|nr:hypothetical protein [Candidatus Bathyarchaeota archaeon]